MDSFVTKMRMNQKTDTDSNFSSSNIILDYGEIACVCDPNKKFNKVVNMKIGDGVTHYNDLDYIFVTEDQLQKYQSGIYNHISQLNNNLSDIKNSTSREIKWTQKHMFIFAVLQIIVIALFALHMYICH